MPKVSAANVKPSASPRLRQVLRRSSSSNATFTAETRCETPVDADHRAMTIPTITPKSALPLLDLGDGLELGRDEVPDFSWGRGERIGSELSDLFGTGE